MKKYKPLEVIEHPRRDNPDTGDWFIGLSLCFVAILLLCALVTMWSIKKVRVDTRVANALESLTERPKAFIYICKKFPPQGQENLAEWLRWSGHCRLVEAD